MNAPHEVQAVVVSLAIGLLMGLDRERSPAARAGVRTFAIVALAGTVSAMLGEQSGAHWLLPAGVLALAVMMVRAYQGPTLPEGAGTTTTAALLLCYLLGAHAWRGDMQVTGAIALVATVLLHFKAELEGVTRRLSQQDLVSLLQFCVITVIVLPLLPDRGFGPYRVLNPYQVWLMVVLISAVSLAGYAALRLVGERRGVVLIGLLGGFVSSTATTLVYARRVRAGTIGAPAAALVVQLASMVVALRLSILTMALAPGAIGAVAPAMGLAFLGGLLVAFHAWRSLPVAEIHAAPELRNPTELASAVGFGVVFALVMLAGAWLNDVAGSRGLYMLALGSGLTDVDALSVTALRMTTTGQVGAIIAARAIALAVGVNLVLKFVLLVSIGGRSLAARIAPGFGAIGAGLLIGAFAG